MIWAAIAAALLPPPAGPIIWTLLCVPHILILRAHIRRFGTGSPSVWVVATFIIVILCLTVYVWIESLGGREI